MGVGTVKKQRLLFLVGQTRVHIDTVQGLGEFLELEVCGYVVSSLIMSLIMLQVVLRPGQLPSEGESIAIDLMAQLGVAPDNLVSGAYMDLLLQKCATSTS